MGRAHLIGIPSWKGGHLREARRRPGSELTDTWGICPCGGSRPSRAATVAEAESVGAGEGRGGRDRMGLAGSEANLALTPTAPCGGAVIIVPGNKLRSQFVVQQWSRSPTQPGPRSSLSNPGEGCQTRLRFLVCKWGAQGLVHVRAGGATLGHLEIWAEGIFSHHLTVPPPFYLVGRSQERAYPTGNVSHSWATWSPYLDRH